MIKHPKAIAVVVGLAMFGGGIALIAVGHVGILGLVGAVMLGALGWAVILGATGATGTAAFPSVSSNEELFAKTQDEEWFDERWFPSKLHAIDDRDTAQRHTIDPHTGWFDDGP